MYLQYFGLKHSPFGKNSPLIDSGEAMARLKEGFTALLHSPGIGLLTGEPGVGKTAALRHLAHELNPHQYAVYYLSETQFTSFDIYRQIALLFGLSPSHRFAQLWRDIKQHIKTRSENQEALPVLIIDEAQNLPVDFFRGLPSFINFDFDAKNRLTLWLVGHTELANLLKRVSFSALFSRIQSRVTWPACSERDQFTQLLNAAFKEAGAQQKLLTETGIELIRVASGGKPRLVNRILNVSMELAMKQKLQFLPDECLHEAIKLLQQ